MKFTHIAALAATASAAVVPRADPAITDVKILNYALTLEHLENRFYKDALMKFNEAAFETAGFPAPFRKNLEEIAFDEQTHVDFLSGALGAAAVAPCDYSFPYTDVKSFVALAQVIENVGVSAYLGAAASIANSDYLTAAGSILTVEARHNTYFRASQAMLPFAYPFDTPLTFDEVYTLAAAFITGCPASNADKPQLNLKAFPSLALGTTGRIQSGETITILTPGYVIKPGEGESTLYYAWITILGPVFGEAVPVDGGFQVKVPDTVNGQSYVVLTGCNTEVTDDTVVAGPAIVEVTNKE